MNVPKDLKYTADHEWVKQDGDLLVVGITDFAQSELGEIVFVEIETEGETLEKDEIFGTIEAVKTVSDMLMPVNGEVVEVNPALEDAPELLNKDPYNEGWIIKVKASNLSDLENLMDADAYTESINA